MTASRHRPESEPLLTPSEVATLFRVDPKTVTRWAKAGKLTSIRTLGGHRRYRESEVRSLLASGQVAPQLAPQSVSAYLLFGSVCEPMTMVEGVFSLQPGHSMTIRTDGRTEATVPKLYWDFARDFKHQLADQNDSNSSLAACAREAAG